MVMTVFYAAIRAHKTGEVRKQAEQKMSGKAARKIILGLSFIYLTITPGCFPSIKISIKIHTVLGQFVIEQ